MPISMIENYAYAHARFIIYPLISTMAHYLTICAASVEIIVGRQNYFRISRQILPDADAVLNILLRDMGLIS